MDFNLKPVRKETNEDPLASEFNSYRRESGMDSRSLFATAQPARTVPPVVTQPPQLCNIEALLGDDFPPPSSPARASSKKRAAKPPTQRVVESGVVEQLPPVTSDEWRCNGRRAIRSYFARAIAVKRRRLNPPRDAFSSHIASAMDSVCDTLAAECDDEDESLRSQLLAASMLDLVDYMIKT